MIYFILRYRLTQVAEYLVNQQTHGQFALTVDQLQLSSGKEELKRKIPASFRVIHLPATGSLQKCLRYISPYIPGENCY
jgi:hypothetical protein